MAAAEPLGGARTIAIRKASPKPHAAEKQASKQVKRRDAARTMVWNRLKFPNMAITFMGKNARTRLRDNQYVFRVEPNYTKHDIKEYLTKVYNIPVLKVNTMNYEGKFKRAFRGKYVYKEKDFKKAIVTVKE